MLLHVTIRSTDAHSDDMQVRTFAHALHAAEACADALLESAADADADDLPLFMRTAHLHARRMHADADGLVSADDDRSSLAHDLERHIARMAEGSTLTFDAFDVLVIVTSGALKVIGWIVENGAEDLGGDPCALVACARCSTPSDFEGADVDVLDASGGVELTCDRCMRPIWSAHAVGYYFPDASTSDPLDAARAQLRHDFDAVGGFHPDDVRTDPPAAIDLLRLNRIVGALDVLDAYGVDAADSISGDLR